jgi:hypothetical protein
MFEAISFLLSMIGIMMAKWRVCVDKVNQRSGTRVNQMKMPHIFSSSDCTFGPL